jgi:hypothetical protein
VCQQPDVFNNKTQSHDQSQENNSPDFWCKVPNNIGREGGFMMIDSAGKILVSFLVFSPKQKFGNSHV